MIIQGGRAGNVGFWASHLIRTDTNERARIVELRGVLADDLKGALREMQAVAGASRCDENFFYQANINPRADERLTPEQWQRVIDRLEANLGFTDHPRIVIEHVKEGRQHHHMIWSRVGDGLKVVSPYKNYRTHERTARELERELGLEPPAPKGPDRERPLALWELEKAQATKIDPRMIKAELTVLWRQADSGKAFVAALEAQGYQLARGDRRGFCVVDHAGTAHSLARRLEGVTAGELRTALAGIDLAELPSVAAARTEQRSRFPDPAAAWTSRVKIEVGRVPATAADPAAYPGRIDRPEATRPDDEALRQRSRELSASPSAGMPNPTWARNAGMVAQQGSAMRWLDRLADRVQRHAPRSSPGSQHEAAVEQVRARLAGRTPSKKLAAEKDGPAAGIEPDGP